MKKLIVFSLALFAITCTAWSQLDTIAISGTAIDTTKVYDGTTTVHIITIGEYPLLPYSQVFIDAEAHYLDASVGVDKPVVVTFTLSGDDAYRYQTPASIVLYADITPLTITADSVELQFSREYDGTTVCEVFNPGVLHGVLPGDTVDQIVAANFSSPNVGFIKPVTVTHTLIGPQAGNYLVVDSAAYLGAINRRSVTPDNISIKTVKEYDGTDTAHVIEQPTLQNVIHGDDINVFATAHYDTPEVGNDKTIYIDYQLLGADIDNYHLTADSVYPITGSIVLPLVFDSLEGDQQFVATAYGFCKNEQVTLRYHLRQGEPAYYRILFSEGEVAVGFDTNWVEVSATDSLITFPVPNGCPAKTYYATIVFQSAAGIASFYPISFRINLPNDYLIKTFDDVVSIDNSGRLDGQPNRFRTFQWLHNDEAIPNANKPYYQAIDGLEGKYAVMVNLGTDDEAMVCPTTFYPADKAVVKLMPSPVVTSTKVELQGFEEGHHQLQVFNSHGVVVHSATFEGSQHLLDLSSLPQGTYLVTVDGRSTKTLKL